MNAPIRGTCSRPRCWSPATTIDRDGRRVCRVDCRGGSGLDALPVVRLEDLPPVTWTPPSASPAEFIVTCPDCGRPRAASRKKKLCAKCERKRWRKS